MGKYSEVVKGLERITDEKPEYQQQVEVVKRSIKKELEGAYYAATLAERYRKLRRGEKRIPETDEGRALVDKMVKAFGKEGLEELLSEVNLRITAHEQLMFEQYEVEGISSLKFEDGGSLGVQDEPYPQVEDRTSYRKWCIDNGYEEMMQLHPSTTSSIVKERLVNGEDVPTGVKVFIKSKLVLRKK
jgi:hypothetical protein